MIRWRRLVRDYERRIDVSTAMILVAIGGISSAETLTPDFQNNSKTLRFAQNPGPPMLMVDEDGPQLRRIISRAHPTEEALPARSGV